MNRIAMKKPVWNGGDSYFSIRVDKITDRHVFIECDYKDKKGNEVFPYAFYTDGDILREEEAYREKWGEAYRVYLRNAEKVFFFFTIAWDEEDGEYTSNRPTFKDMRTAINHYLDKWRGRGAYLECCSMETSKKTHVVDLKEYV